MRPMKITSVEKFENVGFIIFSPAAPFYIYFFFASQKKIQFRMVPMVLVF